MPGRSSGIYINNGKINKRILKEELDNFLSQGWSRGMKPRSKEANDKANKKRKQTCLEKYGVENVHQSQEIKEKCKQTCLEKYGVDNPAKDEAIKQKTKETNEKLWPDKSNYHNLQKMKQTTIERFGSMNNFYQWRYDNMDWETTINKQISTKRKNGTFNYSQPEEDLYKQLCEKYGQDNIKRNYKDNERYPFYCDFYIVSEDLFIELNRHWTHGGHSYNSNSLEDQKILAEWEEKSKTSQYMEYAIYNWTVKDPLKLQTAKKNNLNYQIIW